MDKKLCIKKQAKSSEIDDLQKCTKEDLIEQIKSLTAHNTQLKNIIAKTVDHKQAEHKDKKPFDFSKYTFRHIALKIFYLGWDYHGYVTQEDTVNTVEYYLFEALTRTKLIENRSTSNYHRCGRTDKGVSSFNQTISIDVRSNLTKENQNNLTNEINYCKVLNRVLPDTIQCVAWSPVNKSFNARFDCKSRTYKYLFPKGNLNIEKMMAASKKLLGTHDFRNFCKMDVGNGVVEFIRNISFIDIQPVNGCSSEDEHTIYVISLKGKAFLWHQIRCIMGILFLIGQNKEEPNVIEELFNIEKNPRKPEYNMASEFPLNLFDCEYDDVTWYYDKESLGQVIEKLNSIWTFTAIREAMVKDMLKNLNESYQNIKDCEADRVKCLSECLSQGVKSKKYTPVMKRQTCDSLEDKIKHFTKRNRIEVSCESEK